MEEENKNKNKNKRPLDLQIIGTNNIKQHAFASNKHGICRSPSPVQGRAVVWSSKTGGNQWAW
jgi:hypothetical protein